MVRRRLLIGSIRVGILVAVLGIAAGVAWADDQPSVENLERLTFRRVPGSAAQGSVLDVGEPTSWYRDYVGEPTIYFDGKVYRMWFVGGARTSDAGVPYKHYERIGLAVSTDGLRWQVANEGQPVLDLGPKGSADAKGLAHPYVLRVGDKFMMWYGAIDGRLGWDVGVKLGVRVERICLATSPDGVHWQRENGGKPVIDIGPKGSFNSIQATGMHVLQIGGRFVMWYGAYNGEHSLAVMSSPDGIHWKPLNEGKPVEGLALTNHCGMSVYFDGRRYLMFYGANQKGANNSFAAVSDDGIHFRPLRGDKPVLGPAPVGNFDTAGSGRNHVSHPSQFLISGQKVRVWYMAEDGSPPYHQRIGLMEADLP